MSSILSFCLTSGNVDDRDWSVISKLTAEIFGKLFADRGYISSKLFEKLWLNDIQLITKLKSNMKNKLMDFTDKLLLTDVFEEIIHTLITTNSCNPIMQPEIKKTPYL